MLNSTSAVSLPLSCLEKTQGLISGIGFTLLLSRKTKIVGAPTVRGEEKMNNLGGIYYKYYFQGRGAKGLSDGEEVVRLALHSSAMDHSSHTKACPFLQQSAQNIVCLSVFSIHD